jgi:hypothetical protein
MSLQLVPGSALTVVHRVSVVHGGTGRPFEDFEAELLDPVWPRWRLRKSGAVAVLSTLDRFEDQEPGQTRIEIRLARPELAERFVDGGVKTFTLHQGADEAVTLTLDPVPVQLEVTLYRSNGNPSTGRTVQARGNGHTVPLPAAPAGSNVYRSAPTVWDPAKQPYRIFVNNNQRGFASLDYRQQVTRVRVTEP